MPNRDLADHRLAAGLEIDVLRQTIDRWIEALHILAGNRRAGTEADRENEQNTKYITHRFTYLLTVLDG